MAGPVKDGKVWRHRVMLAGKRYSGTFPTKAHALAWEADKRVNSGGESGGVTKTCKDAFERYELEVSKHKRGYRWEALRLAAMGQTDLGKVLMSQINTTHIADWRDERLRSVSGATVNREMNLLSHVFSTARKEWKWIKESPTKDVRRPKQAAARSRRIAEDEIERICISLGWDRKATNAVPKTKMHRIALAFLFAIETAMRAGEICKLKPADITGRVAHLPMTKNGEARDVPLSPRALEILAIVPDGFELSPASLDAMFRAARDRAAVDGLHFHDTRAEAITRLSKKVDVLTLARIVGHKDIRQLMTYYRESAEDIADKL